MIVRDLLARKKSDKIITITPSDDLATAARLIMHFPIGGLPVVTAEGALVGFLAEREIVRAVNRGIGGIRSMAVEEVMRRPAPTCSPEDSLEEVMTRMTGERLRHLVVVDGNQIVGILSVGDIVKQRIEALETEAGVLRDYVVAQRARG